MEKKKQRLGKGLSALIHTDLDDLDLKQESSGKNLIPINEINLSKFQTRKKFDEKKLKELSESIEKNGLIQPIIVRKGKKKFELIAGERRLKACKLVGIVKISAIVSDFDDRKAFESGLIENLQREDDFGLNEFKTYQEFAKRVEKSKNDLIELLTKLKNDGKRIMSIGATAKSTTVFNYCGIGSDLIELITDTTKDKQGMCAPGSHIPVVDRESVNLNDYDYIFLGAWNLKDYIIKNEKKFNGKFITHVPKVEIVN